MTTSDTSVMLATGDCEAAVDLRGGGLSHLTWRGGDLLAGYGRPGEPATPPLHANTVLAPWPNRTRDAEFTFDGEIHRLTVTEPERNTALHGFVAQQQWTVTDRRTDAVTLTLNTAGQPGWPWPLHLELGYRITADGATATLTARNDADRPVPFACGFHLYPSVPGTATDDCILVVPEHTLVPLDDRGLPTGSGEQDRGVLPEQANPLRDRQLDHCLQLPGPDPAEFRLLGPDGGGVALRTSPGFRWFQVFTSDAALGMPWPGRQGGRAVAVEPMTAPPDALNSGTGLVRLPPGGRLDCSWAITVIPSAR